MRALVTGMLIAMIASAADAGIEAASLESVTARAEVVIRGYFVALPVPLQSRKGQPHVRRYRAEVRVHQVRKGGDDERYQRGTTIAVRIVRKAVGSGAELPELKLKQDYALFLKFNPENSRRPFTTADPQLGVLPLTPPVMRMLSDGTDGASDVAAPFDPLPLAVSHTEQLDIDPKSYKLDQGKAATYTPEKGPVRWLVTFEARGGGLPLQIAGVGRSQIWQIEPLKLQPHVTTRPPTFSDLTGRWRMMLPAGFHHRVTLASVGHEFYVLAPTHLNMGGVYIRDNDRLVSLEEHGRKKERFVWDVRSPYLQTLVESTDAYGATYEHAVLFRPKLPAGETR
ncbi:MAG: hypothetical protein ACF8TS_10880 [Maioricimonas sp. JB049]